MMAIFRGLFMIVAVSAAVGGGTYSYFSTIDEAPGTITAGELTIDILEQNGPEGYDFHVDGLMPGETKTLNFDVENKASSAVPVHLRGLATGSWDPSIESSNPDLMKVVKVEYWNGGWQTLLDNPSGITGLFYYAVGGGETDSMIPVPAGEKAQFQVTVKLDGSAGDKYHGKTFDAEIMVQAKQASAPTWPSGMGGY